MSYYYSSANRFYELYYHFSIYVHYISLKALSLMKTFNKNEKIYIIMLSGIIYFMIIR
jgi:hypothetical protein